MPIVEVVSAPKRAKIGVITLDASIEETHNLSTEITEHPVESGPNISDHIRVKPIELTINGIVTNDPIFVGEDSAGLLPTSPVDGDSIQGEQDRVERAYSKFEEMRRGGELITVLTSLAEYQNMAIRGLTTTRNARNGNSLNIVIDLKEVLIADVETVAAPVPVNNTASATNDQGEKVTKELDDEVDAPLKSGLAKTYDALGKIR